jgi:hypothetical protein
MTMQAVTLENIVNNPFTAIYDKYGRFIAGNPNVRHVTDKWNNFRQDVEHGLLGNLEDYVHKNYQYSKRTSHGQELNIMTGGLPAHVAGANIDVYDTAPQRFSKTAKTIGNMLTMSIWDYLKEGSSPKNTYVTLHELTHKYFTKDGTEALPERDTYELLASYFGAMAKGEIRAPAGLSKGYIDELANVAHRALESYNKNPYEKQVMRPANARQSNNSIIGAIREYVSMIKQAIRQYSK